MLNKWFKNLISLFFSPGDSKPSSTDIELANAYIRLADYQLSRFNKCRDMEWRVNIAFWTLIVVPGGFFIYYYPFPSESHAVVAALILVFLLLVELNCIHKRWLKQIQKKQNKDRSMSFEFRNRAMKLLRDENIPAIPTEEAGEAWTKLARETSIILSVAVYALLLFQTVPDILDGLTCPMTERVRLCSVQMYEIEPNEISGCDYLADIAPLKLSDAEALLRTV